MLVIGRGGGRGGFRVYLGGKEFSGDVENKEGRDLGRGRGG